MKRILLVTIDDLTGKVFCDQLSQYFGNAVEVIHLSDQYVVDEMDLILVTSAELLTLDRFPREKTMVARRTVDLTRLDKLIMVPDGTRCAVENNTLPTAMETIQFLRELGFDLDMVPYCKETRDAVRREQVRVVITPGGTHNIPDDFETVIDIGIRQMDYSTIVEIASALGLSIHTHNVYASRYIHKIIEVGRELARSLAANVEVNGFLDTVLNTVHDGILTIDGDFTIVQANETALQMLDIKGDAVGMNLRQLLPDVNPAMLSREKNKLYTLQRGGTPRHLVMNATPIHVGNANSRVVLSFQDVTRIQRLESDVRRELKHRGLMSNYTRGNILGTSPATLRLVDTIHRVSITDFTVMLLGESGTGKELVAHVVHDLSERRNGPFVPVNFAGLPESLAESELFGYEEGAFTGARRGGKSGLFELANNGTIFLDEIGDASLQLQSLLLRVLQEKTVMRIGGRNLLPVNVRVIAATNKDLRALIEKGSFREDLYYRLNVIPVRLPPLRERKEDIPLLVDHFLKEYADGRHHMAPDTMDALVRYTWPGNIRELVSVVQFMISVADGPLLTTKELPEQITRPSVMSLTLPQVGESLRWTPSTAGEDTEGLITILTVLQEAEQTNRALGRGAIQKRCAERGMLFTEAQIRRFMTVLATQGYLISGVRGQGSRITPQGERALRQQKAKSDHRP